MTDRKTTEAIYVLTRMAEADFSMRSMIMLRLTLRHGISDSGVVAFAVCLAHLGCLPEVVSFFEVAKEFCASEEGKFSSMPVSDCI